MLGETGRPSEAKKSYESAAAIYEKLLTADPSDAYLQRQFALSQVRSGILLEDSGKPIEAMKAYESAVAIFEKLIESNPTNRNDLLNFKFDLAGIYMNIGVLQKNAGQPDEALKSFGNALPIWRKFGQDFPDDVEAQSNLGGIYQNIGALQTDTGKSAEAMKIFRVGPGDLAEADRRPPDRHRVPAQPGEHPYAHRPFAGWDRGARVARAGRGDLEKAGRRPPHRRRVPLQSGGRFEQHGGHSAQHGPKHEVEGRTSRRLWNSTRTPGRTRKRPCAPTARTRRLE